ncbi:GtrA family protein [Natrinema salifodinae]|uniref:Putative flippase GtrA (Transmembrane translocase of bactoprenol-linked glucose) n=1 Tax=Natrinema salifodinae TaxID=1202768 RepID=A0A1I0NJM6_9EURY|nr:GtrA family protein [Natrinema salifodinae]SEW01684.1 Putative flippase GtrA (transmembrane translocase of bactoprenol-linked glucose) [Natrinema salifodinae]
MSDSLGDAVRTRVRALLSTARFGQFVGVGAVGASVDNAVLVVLVEATVLGPVVAKVLSWELGIAVIFAINERWTFAEYGEVGSRALGRRFLRSNVVRFAGFLVTLAVLAALVRQFAIHYVLANIVGIAVGFFVNYTCESLYTWQVHQE